MGKKRGTRKIHRSAVDGRFVTENYANKHPRTTVTETVKQPKKKNWQKSARQ